MAKRYRSEALRAVHESATDLRRAGLVTQRTMRQFDEICLTAVEPMSAQQIRALRRRERVSQTVFARHLNVTPGLVSQWERGERRPRGASLKLLSLAHRKGLDAIA